MCRLKDITLTSLIIDSVEDRILDDERSQILKFIENQDNLFVKIDTNINQFAKIANAQKFVSEKTISNFSDLLDEIAELKREQNSIFKNLYHLLGK